jgi:ectoine hydroxylase-related dioxygenase (phytanoyl-CoA dioxygenase family)
LTGALSAEACQVFERDGFVILGGFASRRRCDAMLARVIEIAREAGGAGMAGHSLVLPESRPNPIARHPEDRVSKVFRLQRDPLFGDFCRDPALLDAVATLLAPELDCFLSQFIFKQPGALGQPWHQDSYYFPFDREPQIGAWLAITEATLGNGPLHVLPGSQTEPTHAAIRDPREHGNIGYVEIVDHDMSGSQPVLMKPGDLLLFHSRLMHKSTDNDSDGLRAAMVYHFAEAGTLDHSLEHSGHPSPVNDWMPVRRLANQPAR